MLPWTMTGEVKKTLLKHDCLGYQYAWQAAAAILTFDDWYFRWDMTEATCHELLLLERWKNETLSVLN